MSPDRHDDAPISFRPAREEKRRLLGYAKRTGRAVNAVIRAAVSEYLDRKEAEGERD